MFSFVKQFLTFVIFFVLFAVVISQVSAYTTYQTTQGPLKLYFGKPDAITKIEKISQIEEPLKLYATFENQADKPLSLKLTFRSIETIEFPKAQPIEPDTVSMNLELAGKETKTVEVEIVARPGTYSAHYPIHLDVEFENDGQANKTNIVLVIETEVPSVGTKQNPLRGQTIENAGLLTFNIVPNHGGLYLPNSDTYRGIWYYDKDKNGDGQIATKILPVGFSGGDKETGVHIYRQGVQLGGQSRQSINMHPPYRGGVGNVGVEYRIQFPETQPISLSFFSAVRDVLPPETPSDGVTFRVLINEIGNSDAGKRDAGKFETVYEKHNAATVWTANEVDLSRFAGKEVLLRLESDPGPKRNTNCDSCYWGDVLLFAGEKPTVLNAEEKAELFKENLNALRTGQTASDRTRVFKLDGNLIGAVTFGHNGFVDGVIGVGNTAKQLQFDGLRIWSKGQAIGSWPSAVGTGRWIGKDEQSKDAPPKPAKGKKGKSFAEEESASSKDQWAQDIEIEGKTGTLFFGLAKNGPAMQFSFDASEADLIERIEFGPATQTADRVYYGHGYCISQPEAFTAGAGGHNLSTSHVGMDFENGLSVLQATSFPPDRFIVDPKNKRYTLSVHPATTITLLPGLSGAIDCAIRYRPICGKQAAPGVAEKSGRFVFDIWGGSYQEHVKTLEQAVRYGLTDSMFIVHSWQRWGYDNRLPDIWPPNPKLGTADEMRQALKIANENGIQYGLHDNYIDIYPDADDFNFDEVTFHENGQPRKAWNNYGIEAQSYQFRPDRIQRFLERNLDLVVPELPMSTYFVDVFTSIPPIDFYDREGNFHSRLESQVAWSKLFDTIRNRLSESNRRFKTATTISEAGMDSLIGHLDGADCQFMLISPESGNFRMKIDCKEWSRVPWFDAVHHTTFSQHGVGYSGRYEAGRGRLLHGIESDDYIVSEILTGHALMVDHGSRYRGAVRKYWLAQDLIRHLADKEIEKVDFSDGNIFRQKISWNDGTIVFVNLDAKTDWKIEPERGRHFMLPQYGYFAGFPNGFSAVYRQNNRVVELTRTEIPENHQIVAYVNARQKSPGADNLLSITPKLNSFEYLGENRFKADFGWKSRGTAPKDYCVFVHCVENRMNWHQKLKEGFLGGGFPTSPTSQWKDGEEYSFAQTISIPDDLPEGRYYLLAGLYDQKGDGRRAKLIGFDTGSDRYAVAWINIQRKGESLGEGKLNRVSKIFVEPLNWNDEELCQRLLPPNEPVDFGFCRTKGAFRIEMDHQAKKATVIPLPEEPATEISLDLIPSEAKSVKAIDADGKTLRNVPFKNETVANSQPIQNSVRFTTQPGEFGYEVVW